LVTHALLTRSPLSASLINPKKSYESFSFDLHVLSTPPALILSQDQTLEKNYFSNLTIQNSGSKFTLDAVFPDGFVSGRSPSLVDLLKSTGSSL
jgi:hypothetical protein